MLQLGYFEIAYNEHNHLKITSMGSDVLYGRSKAQLSTIIPEEERPENRKRGKKGVVEKQRTAKKLGLFAGAALLDKEESEQLFEELRALRRQLAEEELVPPYVIMSDKVLHLICLHRPSTIEAFGQINGIGEYKKRKYGEIFVKVIKRYGGGTD